MVGDLEGQRRKLLRLYYDDRIGADFFAEEEAHLSMAIKAAQSESEASQAEVDRRDDVARHFDDVAQMLAALDVERTWEAATEAERRVLLDEFLECITVLPDYIDVSIHGAPPIHVLYQEVGLKESEFDRVGGPTCNFAPRPSSWIAPGQSFVMPSNQLCRVSELREGSAVRVDVRTEPTRVSSDDGKYQREPVMSCPRHGLWTTANPNPGLEGTRLGGQEGWP